MVLHRCIVSKHSQRKQIKIALGNLKTKSSRHNLEKDRGNPGWKVSAPQKDSPSTSWERSRQAGRRQSAFEGTEREHLFHYMLKPLGEENWDHIKGDTVSGLR